MTQRLVFAMPIVTLFMSQCACPVGKGTTYRPVTISNIAGTSPTFQVEVFNANPGGTASGGAGNSISTVRYWKIFFVSGSLSQNVILNFTYGPDDGVTDYNNLEVGEITNSTPNGSYPDIGGPGTANGSGNITTTGINQATLGNSSVPSFYVLYNRSPGTNPLPVELTSFIASVSDLTTILAWNTATEVNNDGFEVQRGRVNSNQSSGISWGKIGFVDGNGTTNAPHSYSYTDNVGTAGTYSYRLKQIDHNGAFIYSQEVQVTIAAPEVFSLAQNYPDPFNPTTTIQFTVPSDGRTTLKIFNSLGQEVASLFDGEAEAGVYHQVQFNAANLASGTYFSRLVFDGKMQMKKMLLLK